jgi:hypothetical protein
MERDSNQAGDQDDAQDVGSGVKFPLMNLPLDIIMCFRDICPLETLKHLSQTNWFFQDICGDIVRRDMKRLHTDLCPGRECCYGKRNNKKRNAEWYKWLMRFNVKPNTFICPDSMKQHSLAEGDIPYFELAPRSLVPKPSECRTRYSNFKPCPARYQREMQVLRWNIGYRHVQVVMQCFRNFRTDSKLYKSLMQRRLARRMYPHTSRPLFARNYCTGKCRPAMLVSKWEPRISSRPAVLLLRVANEMWLPSANCAVCKRNQVESMVNDWLPDQTGPCTHLKRLSLLSLHEGTSSQRERDAMSKFNATVETLLDEVFDQEAAYSYKNWEVGQKNRTRSVSGSCSLCCTDWRVGHDISNPKFVSLGNLVASQTQYDKYTISVFKDFGDGMSSRCHRWCTHSEGSCCKKILKYEDGRVYRAWHLAKMIPDNEETQRVDKEGATRMSDWHICVGRECPMGCEFGLQNNGQARDNL